MNQEELSLYSRNLGISAVQILREEAEMEILAELSKDKISSQLVFYGGTALRLAYDCPRFSEDIDLIVIKGKSDFSVFEALVNRIVAAKDNWKLTDLKDKRATAFALINIKDEKLKHAFSVRIEIHKPVKKVKLNHGLRLLKSPVSPAQPLLLVPELEELKRLKSDALRDRKKARDVFDLWYIAQAMREKFLLPEDLPVFKERDFRNELQVFLPKKFYPIIHQLYEQVNEKNTSHS